MEPNELIVCRDVSLGYEGQSVLTHLDLTIRTGDYLCIVGDNGSGKSTLLRGLLGLLTPQSGRIERAEELRGAPSGICLSRPGLSGISPPRSLKWCSPAASTGVSGFSTLRPRNPRP